MSYFTDRISAIDPKVVAVAVGYLLTLLVVKVGLDINAVLIPGYLTVNGAIALAGGLLAGWWKSNIATILRTEQEDGNPDPALLKRQAGYGVVGVLLTVLVAVLVYLILAALVAPLVGIIGAVVVLIAGIPAGRW